MIRAFLQHHGKFSSLCLLWACPWAPGRFLKSVRCSAGTGVPALAAVMRGLRGIKPLGVDSWPPPPGHWAGSVTAERFLPGQGPARSQSEDAGKALARPRFSGPPSPCFSRALPVTGRPALSTLLPRSSGGDPAPPSSRCVLNQVCPETLGPAQTASSFLGPGAWLSSERALGPHGQHSLKMRKAII